MTAATLFSGIGAPEVAMPQWYWIWHAEIEKFPSAVMAQRHMHSINLGDVTADDFVERALRIGRPDVVVFGSPCQSYSVAGQRLGLADPRGNLALVALGILARIKPRWFVFENVPGLLSSQSCGLWDFGVFLRAVQECGYQCAWASLDAQYFGVAQRRERVFVVGHSDWRCAAAVLLEPESLCGDSPARSQAGQGVANALTDRPDRGGGNSEGQRLIPDITGTLESRATSGGFGTDFACLGGLQPVSMCLNAGAMGRIDAESETLIPIAHSLRADGFDASEDGTGRGTPLVYGLRSDAGREGSAKTPSADAAGVVRLRDPGFNVYENLAPTLDSGAPHSVGPIAFTMKDYGADAGELSPTLRSGGHDKSHANGGVMPAVAFDARQSDVLQYGEKTGPLDTDGHTLGILSHGVRRLMPVECERLQGFPDNYTAITYRGKPAADGPRYKAIGNSMAVPVIGWILKRLEAVDALADLDGRMSDSLPAGCDY